MVRNLYNDSKNSSNEYDATTHRNLKRQHKINIKNTKQTFYNNKINNAQYRSRETWKIINQRLGKTNYSRRPIQLTVGNIIISDVIKIANHFASHFVTAASNNVHNHFGYNLSLPHTISDNNYNSILFYEVTKSELIEIVSKLKNKRSSGLDGLTIQVVKNIILNIVEY